MSMRPPIRRERGFTLIESIIVLVVLGLAAIGIISLNANIFTGQSDNKNAQVGVALMQECAEGILALRRANGFGAVDATAANSLCSTITLPNPDNNTSYGVPAAAITSGNSSSIAACPCSAADCCKLVSITQSGTDGVKTPITLLLVDR